MPEIVDQYGNPVNKSILRQEIAGPTLTGIRSILSEHPAQSPTPGRLCALLREVETGEVSGDHFNVRRIRATIETAPVERGDGGRVWLLEDLGRNPAEFLTMLSILDWHILDRPELRATLPAVFDGVGLPSGEKAENLYIENPETASWCLRSSLLARTWPWAGCSMAYATTASSIAGSIRFFRFGFRRLISTSASTPPSSTAAL